MDRLAKIESEITEVKNLLLMLTNKLPKESKKLSVEDYRKKLRAHKPNKK